jgi:hypothetical protein
MEQTEHKETGHGYAAVPGYGVRVMQACTLRAAQAFRGLPEGVTRYDLLDLVKRAGRELGFTGCLIEHLEYLIKFTQERDWQPGARPIVYQSVTNMAMELGVDERSINERERKLHQLGAIVWSDIGNFRRQGYRDERGRIVYAYGVDLSPLSSLYPALRHALERRTLDKEAWRKQKMELSSARSALLRLIAVAMTHPMLVELAMAVQHGFEELDRRVTASTTVSDMRERVQAFTALAARLAEALSEATKRAENMNMSVETSDQTENNFRPYNITIQTPTSSLKNTSNPDGDIKRSAATASQARRYMAGSARTGETASRNYKRSGLGNITTDTARMGGNISGDKPANTFSGGLQTGVEYISIRQAYSVSSDMFRAHIPAGSHAIGWAEMIAAAAALCPSIGIGKAAWDEACVTLGRTAAAMCVLIADRRQLDPVNPVTNPGGFLRGCTAKAQAGKLRLHQSIFGILKKQEGQFDA